MSTTILNNLKIQQEYDQFVAELKNTHPSVQLNKFTQVNNIVILFCHDNQPSSSSKGNEEKGLPTSNQKGKTKGKEKGSKVQDQEWEKSILETNQLSPYIKAEISNNIYKYIKLGDGMNGFFIAYKSIKMVLMCEEEYPTNTKSTNILLVHAIDAIQRNDSLFENNHFLKYCQDVLNEQQYSLFKSSLTPHRVDIDLILLWHNIYSFNLKYSPTSPPQTNNEELKTKFINHLKSINSSIDDSVIGWIGKIIRFKFKNLYIEKCTRLFMSCSYPTQESIFFQYDVVVQHLASHNLTVEYIMDMGDVAIDNRKGGFLLLVTCKNRPLGQQAYQQLHQLDHLRFYNVTSAFGTDNSHRPGDPLPKLTPSKMSTIVKNFDQYSVVDHQQQQSSQQPRVIPRDSSPIKWRKVDKFICVNRVSPQQQQQPQPKSIAKINSLSWQMINNIEFFNLIIGNLVNNEQVSLVVWLEFVSSFYYAISERHQFKSIFKIISINDILSTPSIERLTRFKTEAVEIITDLQLKKARLFIQNTQIVEFQGRGVMIDFLTGQIFFMNHGDSQQETCSLSINTILDKILQSFDTYYASSARSSFSMSSLHLTQFFLDQTIKKKDEKDAFTAVKTNGKQFILDISTCLEKVTKNKVDTILYARTTVGDENSTNNQIELLDQITSKVGKTKSIKFENTLVHDTYVKGEEIDDLNDINSPLIDTIQDRIDDKKSMVVWMTSIDIAFANQEYLYMFFKEYHDDDDDDKQSAIVNLVSVFAPYEYMNVIKNNRYQLEENLYEIYLIQNNSTSGGGNDGIQSKEEFIKSLPSLVRLYSEQCHYLAQFMSNPEQVKFYPLFFPTPLNQSNVQVYMDHCRQASITQTEYYNDKFPYRSSTFNLQGKKKSIEEVIIDSSNNSRHKNDSSQFKIFHNNVKEINDILKSMIPNRQNTRENIIDFKEQLQLFFKSKKVNRLYIETTVSPTFTTSTSTCTSTTSTNWNFGEEEEEIVSPIKKKKLANGQSPTFKDGNSIEHKRKNDLNSTKAKSYSPLFHNNQQQKQFELEDEEDDNEPIFIPKPKPSFSKPTFVISHLFVIQTPIGKTIRSSKLSYQFYLEKTFMQKVNVINFHQDKEQDLFFYMITVGSQEIKNQIIQNATGRSFIGSMANFNVTFTFIDPLEPNCIFYSSLNTKVANETLNKHFIDRICFCQFPKKQGSNETITIVKLKDQSSFDLAKQSFKTIQKLDNNIFKLFQQQ
ncbi:hypothetical protein DFA_04594 [Cavenderia fasciculata]|uniref:Uncharacterized protein n=1 Tax=Cavenderia fasciculata TaxID=261658 RepID=F4PQ03_CACFS|nr:uncharacterized protein DFA_04594 [Cavenderia fasciculata]EGG22466.1 hypothetical protein DFA_04594 [Cavenderia fasciculata]|eukprot:XP_004360317.1 hypothetical protein DFA_04594 [Cavenderia fasciculata]